MGNSKSGVESGERRVESGEHFPAFGLRLSDLTMGAIESLGVSSSDELVVGISGGPDSVALSHVLVQLKQDGLIGKVILAHIHHGLRASASDADEELVLEYAKKWDAPIEIAGVDTAARARHEKKGIEETARKIRYEFFEKVAKKHGAQYVVTAHTANDQAETVIMHAIRGAGVRGLAGIPAKRRLSPPPKEGGGRGVVFVIRPWLHVTRDEIEQYLIDNKLQVSRDASNETLDFQRNRVRHIVMPALMEAYPDRSPVQALAGLARRMSELDKFLAALSDEKLEMLLLPNGSIKISGLLNLHGYPLHGVLEAWITRQVGRYRLTELETRKIERFLAAPARRVELRNGITLVKKKDTLNLIRKTE